MVQDTLVLKFTCVGKMTATTEANVHKYREQLEAQQDEIRRLTTISADSRKTVELDQTTQGRLSRMDALQVQGDGLGAGTAPRD